MTATAMREEALVLSTVAIRYEHDVVLARQRARQLGHLLGFDMQEQVRFATAVSELARNAFQYAGGGRITFSIGREDKVSLLVARVVDEGPGIADLDQVLSGSYRSRTGMGVGLAGARRLNDRFAIESSPETGTCVSVAKVIPTSKRLDPSALAAVASSLASTDPNSPYQEIQQQNQDLITALDELRATKKNVDRLNSELEETNKGVVALYAELDERATQMKQLSETKTRFLSDMSHELRTPLTSIINLTRILILRVDGDLNTEQEKQVRLLQRSAESLADMVNDLLDIAKIEAGRVELRDDTVRVIELFATLRGMFRPLATNPNVQLEFADHADLTLRTDEQRLAQILRNFTSNALKFTVEGSVKVGAEMDGDNVRFFVRDTGMGIAPQDLERIFEDFSQVDGPIQRRVRGTGLGLPLTRKLAALLGGRIEMESTLGSGSTFTLLVPRERPTGING